MNFQNETFEMTALTLLSYFKESIPKIHNNMKKKMYNVIHCSGLC